jgi:DNA-binding CsgD family transcriptional regulator
MQVIERESAAYLARDFEAWARCWAHGPHVRRWGFFEPRGTYVSEGWAGDRMKQFMAAHPVASLAEYRRESINLRVGKDMAWVTFDQYTSGGSGPGIDVAEATYEMRLLEKDSEGWKIAYMCIFQRSFDHIASALVRIDPQAFVTWMNPAAEKELQSFTSIVVRAGRLRAVDRDVDQRLQAAIRWAGSFDDSHFLWPRHGALPIVLDGTRGESDNVCWVIAQGGQILIAINDQRITEERLAAAAPVYGITAAQMRLARLIVAGHDLVDAAGRLGVSVNTTRTHLQRMFEKTGVHSQPALVRVLLSVASPLG